MTPATATRKSMTLGEGGTALAFVALAVISVFVAANAYTPEYAFHAYLFAAASGAAVFAIVNRYYERPAELPPLVVDGRPNYNFGPVKFATVAAMLWGIAGFTAGLWAALELAFPMLNLDLPWLSFGRIRPLHTSAVIFAFGGNVGRRPARPFRRRRGALAYLAPSGLATRVSYRLASGYLTTSRICYLTLYRSYATSRISLAHRGASPETVPLAEQGVASRGGGS